MCRRRQGDVSRLASTCLVLTFLVASVSGPSAFAQGSGGWFGGLMGRNRGPGYYPYYGSGAGPAQGSGYNIYGNYGVYGYPGSGIEGGASNSGYDPGYGGYPSYGGYGIANLANRNLNSSPPSPRQRLLGIDEDPFVMPDGAKAMKVSKVFPGSAAEKAGLQAGDVIRSVNGYLTEQRGNLAWIIANATPKNELRISVQTAKDGQNHIVTATLP
jgi:membrane-associated protease RseP (regulator of RpoE activity)